MFVEWAEHLGLGGKKSRHRDKIRRSFLHFYHVGAFGPDSLLFVKEGPALSSAEELSVCQREPLDPDYCVLAPANSKCFSWQPLSKVGNASIVHLVLSHLDCVQSKNLDKYCKPKKLCTLLRQVAINYFK